MANIEIISGDKVTFHKNTVIPGYRQKVERADDKNPAQCPAFIHTVKVAKKYSRLDND